MPDKCPKCEGKKDVILVATGQDQYACPRCRCVFPTTPSVRVAQLGGGGQTSPSWAPGSTPGGTGRGGGYGINQSFIDRGLDAIISLTHRPMPIDPHRNIEKRLEPQHTRGEENSIPYDLNFEDRQKIKLKNEIQRREKFYEDCAKSIAENSPQYIQEHFPIQPEHSHTIEESLLTKRKEPEEKKRRNIHSAPVTASPRVGPKMMFDDSRDPVDTTSGGYNMMRVQEGPGTGTAQYPFTNSNLDLQHLDRAEDIDLYHEETSINSDPGEGNFHVPSAPILPSRSPKKSLNNQTIENQLRSVDWSPLEEIDNTNQPNLVNDGINYRYPLNHSKISQ